MPKAAPIASKRGLIDIEGLKQKRDILTPKETRHFIYVIGIRDYLKKPRQIEGLPLLAEPKKFNCKPIMREFAPSEALADSPAETTEKFDCSCVKMLFALIKQIPNQKDVVAVQTKAAPVINIK
jgi:hypothetical protein